MEREKPRTPEEQQEEFYKLPESEQKILRNEKEAEQQNLEVPEKRPEGCPEIPEEEAEGLAKEEAVEEAEEAQKQKIEKALEILSDPNVMERNPEEVINAFKEKTGKDLIEEREKIVKEHLRGKGKKIIKAEHVEKYRQWIIRKEQEKILLQDHSMALDILWQRTGVREEDREKYLSDLRNKLGLNVKGGVVTLDKLINDGYEVEKAEKSLFSSKVKIPKIGDKEDLFFNSKEDLEQLLRDIKSEITSKAQEIAESKIKEGIQMLKDERFFCAKNIILEAVGKHNLEEQQKQEAELQAQIEREKKAEADKPAGEEKKSEPKGTVKNKGKETTKKQGDSYFDPASEGIPVSPEVRRRHMTVQDFEIMETEKERKKRERPIEKKKKIESGEEPKSFEDWIKAGNELLERFKEVSPGRLNLYKFKEEIFELNKKFSTPKNREDAENFRNWKKDVCETIKRLEKFGKPRIGLPKQESAESLKGEEPAEPKNSDELLDEDKLVDEYVPLRKKYERARGKAKKELGKQVDDLKEKIKKAQERKK